MALTSKEAFELADSVRDRIKKEAKTEEEWEALHKKNPELALIIKDMEDILTTWAWSCMAKIEAGTLGK